MTVRPGRREEVPTFLSRGARIYGRAIDVDGWPCAGVTILAWCRRPEEIDGRPGVDDEAPVADRTVLTDASGRFTLDHIGSTFVIMACDSDRIASHRVVGEIASDQSIDDVTFVMEPSRSIRGRVVDRDGRAVQNARVFALPAPTGSPAAPPPTTPALERLYTPLGPTRTHTGDAGWFCFDQLRDCPHRFVVDADEYPLATETRDLDERGASVIALDPGASVAGDLFDTEHRAIAGAELRLFDRNLPRPRIARSDANGHFEFRGVDRSREIWLAACAPGFAVAVEALPASPGDESIEWSLEEQQVIHGRVVDDSGRAVPYAVVAVRGDRRVGSTVERALKLAPAWEMLVDKTMAYADADGHFRLDSLYPGDYELNAFDPDEPENATRQRVTSHGEAITVVVDRGSEPDITILGRVRSTNGDVITDFEAVALATASSPRPFGHMTLDRSRGRFVVAGRRQSSGGPTTIEITVAAPGYRQRSVEVALQRRDSYECSIELDRGHEPSMVAPPVTGETMGSALFIVSASDPPESLAVVSGSPYSAIDSWRRIIERSHGTPVPNPTTIEIRRAGRILGEATLESCALGSLWTTNQRHGTTALPVVPCDAIAAAYGIRAGDSIVLRLRAEGHTSLQVELVWPDTSDAQTFVISLERTGC